MKSLIELLQETHLKLFSLDPTEALALKAYTIQLLKDLPATEYQQLVHQIAQQRKIQEDFLSWLDTECSCAECEEN
jgi:hypothetical protein